MASAHRTVLIILALAVPLAAQSAPEDPPPAIIEGSVINVQNSRTIPRATVTLLHSKGTGSKSQRADGSGHFMFKNVEPGIYRLMAERQGFFPTTASANISHCLKLPPALTSGICRFD